MNKSIAQLTLISILYELILFSLWAGTFIPSIKKSDKNHILTVLGELLTTAQWMRRFVELHPDYKKDSIVSETICYDLLNTFDRISKGEVEAPELFGKPISKTSDVPLKKLRKRSRK